jgi:DnaA N-terminal domain
MLMKKPVGQNAATRKYDLISILGAHGLAGGKAGQRLALRLICLITARYNWLSNELSVGQGEIAKLWSVDLRTVKREMAVLRARGWLVEKRGAARGRVTLYGLGIDQILADTRPDWGRIGSDLVARLDGPMPQDTSVPSNVVQFVPLAAAPDEDTLWGKVRSVLHAEQPTVFAAWIAAMEMIAVEDGQIVLKAPSVFHASYVSTHLAAGILAVMRRFDPEVISLRIC